MGFKVSTRAIYVNLVRNCLDFAREETNGPLLLNSFNQLLVDRELLWENFAGLSNFIIELGLLCFDIAKPRYCCVFKPLWK